MSTTLTVALASLGGIVLAGVDRAWRLAGAPRRAEARVAGDARGAERIGAARQRCVRARR